MPIPHRTIDPAVTSAGFSFGGESISGRRSGSGSLLTAFRCGRDPASVRASRRIDRREQDVRRIRFGTEGGWRPSDGTRVARILRIGSAAATARIAATVDSRRGL